MANNTIKRIFTIGAREWPINRVEYKISDDGKEVKIFVYENRESEMLRIVPASKLSPRDKFLQYEPETDQEREFKDDLLEQIKYGLKDFKHPIIDPSVDKEGRIFYQFGSEPGRGYTTKKWEEMAGEFMPEKNSRLGNHIEYNAFVGCIMKQLVDEGVEIRKVWKYFIIDSSNLGNYNNSSEIRKAKTGSNGIVGWFDLANYKKIIKHAYRNGDYLLASGSYDSLGVTHPVARIRCCMSTLEYVEDILYDSTGWIVTDI